MSYFKFTLFLSLALLLTCKHSRSQRVELNDALLSHSPQAIGSNLTVTITADVLSQEDAAIPLNWYFDGNQIWNVFMSNKMISEPSCTNSGGCERFPLVATIIQQSNPLIVQHQINITKLTESDNAKTLRLEYSTQLKQVNFNVKACNVSVSGQAINLTQSMEVCGVDCEVTYTCEDGYSPAQNITSVCQENATFAPSLEEFQCNSSSSGDYNMTKVNFVYLLIVAWVCGVVVAHC